MSNATLNNIDTWCLNMKIQLFLKSIWKLMESAWQNILHILKILLLSSFFESIYIACLLIAGPKRSYEEYLLVPLFFTLFQFIFKAICFLVISPIILIIKNLRIGYKWIIIFILLSICFHTVWQYEFPAYNQDMGELIESNTVSFLRAVGIEFIFLVLAYYCLHFWSKKWQKRFLE